MRRTQILRPYYRTQEVLKELKPVFQDGWTGLGPRTEMFERELANYFGVKYATFLNSGTSALHLAVKLLRLKPGTEVITTPLTFVSTNHVLLYEGLKPVFCDVDDDTGCIDAEKIEELITENVGAIMVVHYGGTPAAMGKINDIARTYNIPIIEDCAHAFGSEYGPNKIGNSHNICCFSFHSVKQCPICDGGAITTNNRLYNERLQKLRWLGIDKSTYVRTESSYGWEYNVEEVGFKYHGNDILAAIGRVSLRHVDEDNARRQEIVDMYRDGFHHLPWLRFVPDEEYMQQHTHLQSSNHLCVIRVPRKREFIERLKKQGVDCGCHYTLNSHYSMYDNTKLEVATKMYEEMVTIPLHMMLTDADVKNIIKTIREVWD